MGFAADLLDGFELLYRRTEGVLGVSSEMGEFFKRISTIESDYSKALGKLCKGFAQKKLISNPHLDGTIKESWVVIIQELDSLANAHESFSVALMKELSKGVNDFVKEKEITRKKLTSDGQKLTKEMKAQLDNLTRSKGNFVKLSKEAEAAALAVIKCPTDPANAKKLSGLQQKSQQATEKAQQSDLEYQETLKATNSKQNTFYTAEMPNLLHEFQQFEDERINFTKNILSRMATLVTDIPPIGQQAASHITQVVGKIDPSEDIENFASTNKTGVTTPPPIEYVPFEGNIGTPRPSGGSPVGSPSVRASVTPPVKNNRATGAYKAPEPQARREWGLSAGDQSLAPDQKKYKLDQQTAELDTLLKSEMIAKSGVEKLVQFYASDPVAQRKAEDELAEAERKVKALQDGKRLIQSQLAELGYGDSNSLQNSSDNFENVDPYSNRYSEAAQSQEGMGAGGVGGGGNVAANGFTVIAKARGLFDYNATCDTELSFRVGDILNIQDQDASGWWYAELNGKAGFIPQNYVESI